METILNETYSLGNDINAAANRFYNAGINFVRFRISLCFFLLKVYRILKYCCWKHSHTLTVISIA